MRPPAGAAALSPGRSHHRHPVYAVDMMRMRRLAPSRVQRRYASMTGATRDTSSSLLADATASAFTTWRSIAMPNQLRSDERGAELPVGVIDEWAQG